jgi:ABC-2 type transport system ATP-binding protein
MKIIAGLLRPTQGKARVCGYDVVEDTISAKKLLAYIPDEPYLYDKLTGREFMYFVGDLYGMSRSELDERSKELIDAFEMGNYLDELAEGYSHGMKQRVVVSAALVHSPKALVIDEPTVGLDPRSARHMRDLLRKLARDNGSAIFMSTHVLPVAEQLADRIGIMDHGNLLACAGSEEIKNMAGTGSLEETFLKLTEESVEEIVDETMA